MIPKEEIEDMYWGQGMLQKEIADVYNTNGKTVSRLMRLYDIETRTPSESQLKRTYKPSKEELEDMYLIQEMSQSEIAKVVCVSQSTIYRCMVKYSIKSRTDSESLLKGKYKPSRERLEDMYWKQEMTMDEIAEVFGVFHATVGNWMRKYGIETRTRSESILIRSWRTSKEELEKMYWDKGMSKPEIAKKVGVSQSVVRDRMREYNIESRTTSEALINGDFTGERSGAWKGGVSFEPYCEKFNDKFRESVRERDNYTCQLCGCDQEPGGRRLSVHHIHYDKSNCWPDVVALCRSCHAKTTSGDRDYWEQYFENQLSERGLTCWSISQEIENT